MLETEKLILHNAVFRKDERSARHAVLLFCVFIFSHLSETVLCCNQRTWPPSSGLIILYSCKWHIKLRLYVHFKSRYINMKQVHIWTHALHLNQHQGRLAQIWTPLSVLCLLWGGTETCSRPAAAEILEEKWSTVSERSDIFYDFGKCLIFNFCISINFWNTASHINAFSLIMLN